LGLGSTCGRFPLRVVGAGERLRRSRAANTGLEAARGKHVIFLDDDDWFYPNHLAELATALGRERYARVAYGGIESVDIRADGTRVPVEVWNDAFDPIRLLCQNYIPIHAVLFERALYLEGCRFDEAFDLSEDWDFWIQLSLKTPFVHVANLVGGGYRHPGGSALYEHGRAAADASLQALFGKWRARWTPEQLLALMEAARLGKRPAAI
jgi:glycosyltransferase involved in cell wall biosynthesis